MPRAQPFPSIHAHEYTLWFPSPRGSREPVRRRHGRDVLYTKPTYRVTWQTWMSVEHGEQYASTNDSKAYGSWPRPDA